LIFILINIKIKFYNGIIKYSGYDDGKNNIIDSANSDDSEQVNEYSDSDDDNSEDNTEIFDIDLDFIKDTEELKRAKRYHLEKTISILPWIAAVDSFQHWIYENPNHTQDERETEWVKIIKSFNGEVVDWSNYPEVQANLWHKQLHIFEVPFYYIEYAIAQLGAIAVWKNYKQNPESALKAFEKALSAGNTLTLPELYALSGIKFSFERSYIDELMQFILKELNNRFHS
jgi:M3 family oligoendopeptidase